MPLSLNSRILVAAGVVLIAFLGTASFAIDRSFRATALTAVHERLKAQIFMLLGMANFDAPGAAPMPAVLPDPSLSVPDSGHYAQVFDGKGELLWRSRSMLGFAVQPPPNRPPGEFFFDDTVSSTDEALFCTSYGVEWETRGRAAPRIYTLQACEGRESYVMQVRGFQRSLWVWFSIMAALLLLIQTAILRWGLRPLRAVALEVRAIESGRQAAITGEYPRELRALTRNLNALIAARDTHVQRYRNALGDLAHSLKTPLAVLRSALEVGRFDAEPVRAMQEQVAQIDDTVRYQLQRAATVGRSAFAPPVEVAPMVERIAGSLRKVYHARELDIDVEVDGACRFFGDQGDLMEVVGNLADNACKWARHRVAIRAQALPLRPGQRRHALEVTVEDDGPGMPEHLVETALRRGGRLDESAEGHGIGLSVVRDVIETGYGGILSVEAGPSGTTVKGVFEFD
jgi:two-component system sensor histidine kinase PhoQ